jgi:hypothetical protein
MNVGALIQILRLEVTGIIVRERWKTATVTKVDGERFCAEVLRGTLTKEGHKAIWLPEYAQGRMWRYL